MNNVLAASFSQKRQGGLVKNRLTLGSFVLVLSLAIGNVSLADNCDSLNGQLCMQFNYSTGASNQYTATFNNGVFDLGGISPGTYTCWGSDFVEVNYMFGGFESQVWYAEAGAGGSALNGHGKSLTNGYLYNLSVASVGPCFGAAAMGSTQSGSDN